MACISDEKDVELVAFASAASWASEARERCTSLIERVLLQDEIRVLHSHGHHGHLTRELAIDLVIRLLVMHEEVKVVEFLLLSLSEC